MKAGLKIGARPTVSVDVELLFSSTAVAFAAAVLLSLYVSFFADSSISDSAKMSLNLTNMSSDLVEPFEA